MKIIELEIKNVRGIPDLLLKPNGKNFVIYGPNGSGKSAVVDSIDFLLTGRISRLTGEGTGEISLGIHGPHISHEPNEAIVCAKIKIPEIEQPIKLKRCMGQPSKLEYDNSIKSYIQPIIELAKRGQYVLTRRDILKYVTAPPNTRAKEIQTLLNIQDVESIRKNLIRISNKFYRRLKGAEEALNTAKEVINDTTLNTEFDEESIIKFINKNRSILGGRALSTLDWEDLKKELIPSIKIPKIVQDIRDIREINNSIEFLQNILSNSKKISRNDERLRSLMKEMKERPELLRDISRLELTELGINLIDETGNCPLCDTYWEKGELRKKLEDRISKAIKEEQIQKEINEIIQNLTDKFNSTKYKIFNILQFISQSEIKTELKLYQSWLKNIQEFIQILNKPYDKYIKSPFNRKMIQRILAPNDINNSLRKIQTLIKEKFEKIPKITPEMEAWDNLTRLEENLKVYKKNMYTYTLTKKYTDQTTILSESFQQAKDIVLSRLYEEINDRFIELYRKLHKDDEKNFSASITSDGAGINFKVDFYGFGYHPPHALHSEGHQDSMGLCLYLALVERINKELIDLVILDDVVMSVDSGHRRNVCNILTNCFPDRQFLITTHDKTWTNQLKYDGVVNSKEITEFYNWDITTGPIHFNYQVEIWDPINKDLEKNDVPSAAARLRRGLEQFFGMVCNDLQASVTFKLDGRYELGDFFKAAMQQYRELIKKAKASAQSWKKSEMFERLNELDSNRTQILERTQAERWTIDANVHFNNWINLKVDEFRPVVEAFHDLCLLFKCNQCGGIFYVTKKGQIQDSVRCNCGNINWNLIKNN